MMLLLRVSAGLLFVSSYVFAGPYEIGRAVELFREKHTQMRDVLSKMSTQFYAVGKGAKKRGFPLKTFKKSDQVEPQYPKDEPVLPGFLGFAGLLTAHRVLFEDVAIIESNPGQNIPAEVEKMIKEDLEAVKKLLPLTTTHVFLVETPFVMNAKGIFTLLKNSRMIESEQQRYLQGKNELQSIRGFAMAFIPKSNRYDALVLEVAKSPPADTAQVHNFQLAYHQDYKHWRVVAFSPEKLREFMADAMQQIDALRCRLEHYKELLAKGGFWRGRKIASDDMKNPQCGGSAGDTEPYRGRRYTDEDDEDENSPYRSDDDDDFFRSEGEDLGNRWRSYDRNRSFRRRLKWE